MYDEFHINWFSLEKFNSVSWAFDFQGEDGKREESKALVVGSWDKFKSVR